ncbi:MAG: RadC family protein [Bacillota bacterium]
MSLDSVLIKDMPVEERPRERMFRLGPKQLSNSELLAIILGTGRRGESALQLSNRLLSECGGLRGLFDLSLEELSQIPGIGLAKASKLGAITELATRIAENRFQQAVIRHPSDVEKLLMSRFLQLDQEEFVIVLLDTKNQVLAIEGVFLGSLNASIVHPREVFKRAIRRSAAGMIVAHNHPSGDPTPSREDINVTRRLTEAGKIIGIEVLDHIIFGDGKTISLKEKGLV